MCDNPASKENDAPIKPQKKALPEKKPVVPVKSKPALKNGQNKAQLPKVKKVEPGPPPASKDGRAGQTNEYELVGPMKRGKGLMDQNEFIDVVLPDLVEFLQKLHQGVSGVQSKSKTESKKNKKNKGPIWQTEQPAKVSDPDSKPYKLDDFDAEERKVRKATNQKEPPKKNSIYRFKDELEGTQYSNLTKKDQEVHQQITMEDFYTNKIAGQMPDPQVLRQLSETYGQGNMKGSNLLGYGLSLDLPSLRNLAIYQENAL